MTDVTSPNWTPSEAIEAIRARLQGVFDHPQLVKLGPLGDVHADVLSITDAVTPDPVLAAVADIDPSYLSAVPPGAIAAALEVCEALAGSSELEGFDFDDEVNGGDAVDVLGQLWPRVRTVVPLEDEDADTE